MITQEGFYPKHTTEIDIERFQNICRLYSYNVFGYSIKRVIVLKAFLLRYYSYKVTLKLTWKLSLLE